MKPKTISDRGRVDYASRDGLVKLGEFAEWMTCSGFEDGTPRLAPTMTIWCTNGEWRANLRDRQEGLCLWLSAPTWGDLLKMVNEFCLNDVAPWRHDDPANERNGKRQKKG